MDEFAQRKMDQPQCLSCKPAETFTFTSKDISTLRHGVGMPSGMGLLALPNPHARPELRLLPLSLEALLELCMQDFPFKTGDRRSDSIALVLRLGCTLEF